MQRDEQQRSGFGTLLLSAAIFGASAANLIPPVCFFGGLVLAPIGVLQVLRSHRRSEEELEQKIARSVNPELKNSTAMRNAEIQARRAIELDDERRHVAQRAAVGNEVVGDELVLYDVEEDKPEDDFQVTTDVSFPFEVQRHEQLADQIEKLRELAQEGAITQEEFEAAKARLLA